MHRAQAVMTSEGLCVRSQSRVSRTRVDKGLSQTAARPDGTYPDQGRIQEDSTGGLGGKSGCEGFLKIVFLFHSS